MSNFRPRLCEMLNIDFPIIAAPMFLVSNVDMTVAAIKSGITAAIPALNYRELKQLREAIREIKSRADGPFGINIIVNKSNFKADEQLKVCCEEKVDFIITSLGSPEKTIKMAKEHGVKVFCDVVDAKFAKKVEALGADAIIAVNKEAGGHAGNDSQDLRGSPTRPHRSSAKDSHRTRQQKEEGVSVQDAYMVHATDLGHAVVPLGGSARRQGCLGDAA